MVNKDLKIWDVIAKPGESKNGFIKGVELDFQGIDIPIIVANGKHDGPILSIAAAVHGTEISGVEVIRRVLNDKVHTNELSGAIVAVPVCNPLAFSWHEHISPQDRTNMSTVFPGDSKGSLTKRLAHKIWKEVLTRCEYNIDIHHDGWPAIPYVLCKSEIAKNKETGDKSLAMAYSTGLTILHQGKNPFWGPNVWGSLTDATVMEGIPSATVELNAPMGRIVNDTVDLGVRAVLNVMKHLKMISGEIEKQPASACFIPGEFVFMVADFPKTTRGGVMIMQKGPGEFIRKGEKIATVYSIFGEKLEDVIMTVDGYMWASSGALVSEGSNVAPIFGKWDPELMKRESKDYGSGHYL